MLYKSSFSRAVVSLDFNSHTHSMHRKKTYGNLHPIPSVLRPELHILHRCIQKVYRAYTSYTLRVNYRNPMALRTVVIVSDLCECHY